MTRQVLLAGTIVAAGVAFGARAVPERETVEANGVWEMAQATVPEKWMPAVVPGTVRDYAWSAAAFLRAPVGKR